MSLPWYDIRTSNMTLHTPMIRWWWPLYIPLWKRNGIHTENPRRIKHISYPTGYDPHTVTETIRYLLTMYSHSGVYFFPVVLQILILPSQYARLNLDSSEKSKQGQLFVAVQLRALVHHRRRRSRLSRIMSGFALQHGCILPDHGAFCWQFIWKLDVQGV